MRAAAGRPRYVLRPPVANASRGANRSGWKISPTSTIALSQGHVRAARCLGESRRVFQRGQVQPAVRRQRGGEGGGRALAHLSRRLGAAVLVSPRRFRPQRTPTQRNHRTGRANPHLR
jgi:hypothetical protein